MVCGPVCGRSRRREVEDEEEEGWKPKLRTPGRQPFPHKCSLLWVWVAVSFSKVPYDNALATLAQASACSGNGLGEGGPHQVSVPPGFCRARDLVPVQGEAKALILRDVHHQVHVVAMCRHVEHGQGCGGGKERDFLHLICTPKPAYPPTAPLEFPSKPLD